MGPSRSLSCPTRVRSRHSSAGIRESQKHPQPLTYHLQELPQSQRLLSLLQACGHFNKAMLGRLSPGQRGAGALSISPRSPSISLCHGWVLLCRCPERPGLSPRDSCSTFVSPRFLLQVYLPRSPALGFPIHLAHAGLPESAADLPRGKELKRQGQHGVRAGKAPERDWMLILPNASVPCV